MIAVFVLVFPFCTLKDDYMATISQKIDMFENPKVFVSQPMKGKTKEKILEEREKIKNTLDGYFRGIPYTIIDSVLTPPKNTTNEALWCLGRSLQLLSEPDVAIFAEGWELARGCWLEHESCLRYSIPTLYA